MLQICPIPDSLLIKSAPAFLKEVSREQWLQQSAGAKPRDVEGEDASPVIAANELIII